MADFTVHVFVNSKGEAIVSPAYVIARQNKKIDIVNTTGDYIHVFYPADVFDDGRGGKLGKHNNPIRDREKNEKKVHDRTDRGAYRYSVFCFKTGTLAKGNSDPEFIIE
jgi:hypothetical protein